MWMVLAWMSKHTRTAWHRCRLLWLLPTWPLPLHLWCLPVRHSQATLSPATRESLQVGHLLGRAAVLNL